MAYSSYNEIDLSFLLTIYSFVEWHPFINVVLQLKDGRFASASRDRTIRIWKYIPEDNIFKEDEVLSDYGHGMYALIQLDDGRLCSATSDNALVIWRNRMEEY